PLPPARFEVSPEKTTSTTLQVRWTPSSGKVTWYEVQLFDENNQKIQEVQVQESTTWSQHTFLNLTAVPSPVKDIGIAPNSNSLLISWSRGSGNVEQYRLMLMDKGTLVQDRNADKRETSSTFHGLTPGHLYNLTIITMASGLQNYRWKLVRTTPMEVSNLKVTNDGSSTSLKVKWQKPPGDVDSYNITLSHQGTIKESKTLAPWVTETQFKDLVPGRLYHVTISCVSGELSAQKLAMGRTEKVRNLVSYNEIWMKSFAVNWTPPAGDWEHYRIMLFNESLALLNTTVGKEESHYVIDGVELIPGRQYEVEVIVESGNLRNSERCRGRTVPLAVLQLRVKDANETSLAITWQAPTGEWEKYIISLTDRDLLVIHKSLSKDAKEFTFTDLIPGRNYKATITSMSGDLKQSSSTRGRTVPAQVTDLHVTNQGMASSLFTNWTKALGDVEFYQVLLIHENVVIKNESVSSETSRYSFHALKSGSLYSVVVTTVSGGISSRQVVVEGRTVPSSVSGVTVNNSGRNDYLSVSWLPAPGDVDNYVVTLSHDGEVVQSLITAKSVSECSFSSLTPGRLYNVTITTRSGDYASHSFSEERT
ncbi:hypothetical protein A6R68_23804, partial [Neotoma lepida]